MKKLLILVSVAAVSSLALGVQAFAEPAFSIQPTCADITSARGGTSASWQGTDMLGFAGLEGPSHEPGNCDDINYTMIVVTYGARTGWVSSVSTDTIKGAPIGGQQVGPFHVTMPPATYACVFFVSSHPRGGLFGGALIDVAPDAGCPLKLNVAQPWAFPFNVIGPGGLTGDKGGFE